MIRAATPDDGPAIAEIALAHGFDEPDCALDARYRALVAAHGRLLVAVNEDDRAATVVGFGGMIVIGSIAMITDLFLLPDAQGRGLGGRLIHELTDGFHDRMTFSSAHPAAVPAYRRAGLQPRWRLSYLRGTVVGDTHAARRWEVSEVSASAWQGPRPELATHWSQRGARLLCGTDDLWAVVTGDAREWRIEQLSVSGDHAAAIAAVMAVLPHGDSVLLCTPEHGDVAMWLDRRGFVAVDHDVWCSTTADLIPSTLAVLHPGLG